MKPIDADVLVKRINSIMEIFPNVTVEDIVDMIIYKTHALDVRPNIHAHWIKSDDPNLPFICSNCCEYMKEDTPFCSDCGAEMDEEEYNEVNIND